jgi:DNA-binding MarR family transcriptional regulator
MSLPSRPGGLETQGTDARLVLHETALDAALELFVLSEAALASTAEAALEGEGRKLGRGHWRIAFLLKRRPGLGVQALAALTGLSKQGVSRTLADLDAAGLVAKEPGEDARRRHAVLTPAGAAFERKVSERLRAHLARSFRNGGLDAVPAARRIIAAVAGPRVPAKDRP